MKTQYDYYRVSKDGGWLKRIYLKDFHCLTSNQSSMPPYDFNLTYEIYTTPKVHFDPRYIK